MASLRDSIVSDIDGYLEVELTVTVEGTLEELGMHEAEVGRRFENAAEVVAYLKEEYKRVSKLARDWDMVDDFNSSLTVFYVAPTKEDDNDRQPGEGQAELPLDAVPTPTPEIPKHPGTTAWW